MLDMELAVTSALNELASQRKMAEQEQEEALEMLAIALERVAEGNLVQSVDEKLKKNLHDWEALSKNCSTALAG